MSCNMPSRKDNQTRPVGRLADCLLLLNLLNFNERSPTVEMHCCRGWVHSSKTSSSKSNAVSKPDLKVMISSPALLYVLLPYFSSQLSSSVLMRRKSVMASHSDWEVCVECPEFCGFYTIPWYFEPIFRHTGLGLCHNPVATQFSLEWRMYTPNHYAPKSEKCSVQYWDTVFHF